MSMEVRKESNGLKNSMVTREELAIINQYTSNAFAFELKRKDISDETQVRLK